MSTSSRKIDRLQATFDHESIVANAGLILVATLMARLGLESSRLDRNWVLPSRMGHAAALPRNRNCTNRRHRGGQPRSLVRTSD